MPAVRLESLEEIFEHARSLPPRERETFLESCSDDPGVRDELASLLEAAAAAEPFFAELAAVASPTALVGEAAGPELALDRVGLPEGSGLEVGDTVAQYPSARCTRSARTLTAGCTSPWATTAARR
ncbi:MAG: hypothetical protein P8Y07_14990 [Gemmatimonadales bacterium]